MPPLDLVATGYACGAGPEGATCAPVCPDGYSLQGDGCVPAGEACNNGVDDDHDGLIDGVLTGEDPCAASLAPAVPVQLGTCDPLAAQSCDAPDDAARLAAGGGLKPRDTCTQAPCPARVRLDYAYALDREEVSLRAYLQCVRTGCCLAASGALYKKAERFLEANEGNLRPEAAARTRCEAAPDPEDPAAGARLLDLPVTGVTWCQARDYCHWAGKRLATEVELAHASAGDAPIRRHPWGDGELPECGADQACRSSDCAPGDASCEALGLCPADAQPAAGRSSRRACFARYGGGEVLCGDTGAVPTPVWANEDGATPEGVLNLTGNVAEWAFDWSSPNLDGLPDADSVGPACGSDAFGQNTRRVVRGQTPSEPAARMHGFARTAISPAAREPFLGFRCARTEDASGGRCVDDVPSNRRDDATCQPPPLPVGATEVACGPSFGAVTGSALDQAVCGGVRVQTEACAANLPSVCPAGGPGPSCGGFALTRLRLFNQAFPNVDPATGDAFAGLFDLSFAPNGGDTWLLLDTPAEFGHQDGLAGASFGTALPVGDALTWLGVSNGAECGGLEHTQGLLLRSGFGQIAPICGEARPGELLAPEVATRLHWSGLAMALIYNARSDTLGGGVALAFSQADALQSMLGGERLTEVLQRLRVPRLPLCNSAAIGGFLPGCAGAPPLGLAGCVGDVCTDPETCTGFVLPLELAAVRISRALVDGHLPATLVCP